MASQQYQREQLERMARQGETVVPGGTGGNTLQDQQHLAQGRSRGGETRKEKTGGAGHQEMGRKGGGGDERGTTDKSGDSPDVDQGIDIDETK